MKSRADVFNVRDLYLLEEKTATAAARAGRSLDWQERVDLALTHLRALVNSKKVKQKDVAIALGVHEGAISFWVGGRWRPDGSRLLELEKYLEKHGASLPAQLEELLVRGPWSRKRIMEALRHAVAVGGSDAVVAGLARLYFGKNVRHKPSKARRVS